MKAYKGFDKNLQCREFQYEEGKEYEHEGNVKCCEEGFHACEYPLDCFDYYAPADSVYHEVELGGAIDTEGRDDTKVSAQKIKIGAIEADRCECCDYCKSTKKLTRVISADELTII